ncbi:hypothetical protein BDQ12DRAFT_83766 [Crucibulum laeve]|uniref:Uncharacterized protein n=1 Tax=Crucibulum laeve TaxID=68775 RepID=A0A5C3M157_9AGAR|nr:hypothetical protein BDQ12DRAFT_83766 [Crucibulum laeve]
MYSNLTLALHSIMDLAPSPPSPSSPPPLYTASSALAVTPAPPLPSLSALLSAYLQHAGFSLPSAEAITAFERALEKHPDSGDEVSRVIALVRRRYWYCVLKGRGIEDVGADMNREEEEEKRCMPCGCCGRMVIASKKHAHAQEGEHVVVSESALVKVTKKSTSTTTTSKTTKTTSKPNLIVQAAYPQRHVRRRVKRAHSIRICRRLVQRVCSIG